MPKKQHRPDRSRGAGAKGPGGSRAPRVVNPTAPTSGLAAKGPAAASRAYAPKPSSRRPIRNRQIVAVGLVAAALVAAIAFVVATQANQPGGVSLAPDRHFLGNASAPVTITEWSDFQ
jgi:hypothetical protein